MARQDTKIARRKFVKLAGMTALVAPIAGLTACGGDKKAAAPSAPAPAAEKAAAKPAAKPAPKPAPKPMEAKPAAVAVADLPKVDENGPIASSLGYKHNAADVDTAKFPKRGTPEAANQYCQNCVLFSGGDADWGPCSIFAGQKVSAKGWCATYAARG